ncbi:xaa-Pro aminopeptidase ApepP isoform X2 [Schistocerca americana]|uniref:xaa-Pro aminopeptidase ApepP isoform X2 n=1 Tax=Schistocerca americana TaxID=7009 RepID=UPI001F4FD4AD|nr:xaa-Pro aminopeptidase ApepP isoform X2 [Schistocerca americana]
MMTSGDQNMAHMKHVNNLVKLRSLFKNLKYVPEPIQGYVVPSDDAHQSEYLAECDKRRAFISGFTGSAGTAVITETQACLWTDGRYFLQATKQMDDNWTLMKEGIPTTPTQGAWLSKALPAGSRVGVDPKLISYSAWKPLQTQLEAAGHSLVPVATNLIDLIWDDRPAPPKGTVEPLPLVYTGKTSKTKVEEVRTMLAEKGATLLVVTALDEVAWLLNLRGSDIAYNPVFFSYALVTMHSVHLFMDECKLTPSVRQHFNQEDLCITIHPYEKIQDVLTEQISEQEGKVWISAGASYALTSLIPDKKRVSEATPIALMKAIKNNVEIQGMINAHIRDAAALCCYFAWLEKEVVKGTVSEVSGASRLEEFRREQENFVGPSFETISSSGPNGAIIHYTPSPESDRLLTVDELYLCDSGGQYKDGTTDVTRTIHFGTPTQFEKECFTRVFKGQFFMGTSVFPTKIKGNCLDTLARKYLWDVGLDYLHGTGHGIGSFLNVHEGPMGISWRIYPEDPGLQEGMFLSNEPGFYEDGKFGIRLENICRIVPANVPYKFKDHKFLTFETVTLVPIQTKMLVREMLTDKEVAYLNDYHKQCREKVGPLLKKMGHHEAWEWLCRETEPIV